MTQAKTLIQIAGGSLRLPNWQESVLIIIDHQTEYTTGAVPMSGIDDALLEIAALLRQARQAGAPVMHVVHHAKPGSALFDPTREWVNIIDGVQPLDGEVIVVKSLPNAFAATTLDAEIKKTGRKNLIITGFATHMCVSTTTRSALDHGYASTVVAAACATRDLPDAFGNGVIPAAQVQRAALTELADRFALIVADAKALEATAR